MDVMLVHAETGEIRPADIGWSWELWFCMDWFFIPLIRRELNGWAVIRLCGYLGIFIFLMAAVSGSMESERSLQLMIFYWFMVLAIGIFLGVSGIFLCLRGNELSAKKLLKSGWTFADPESWVAEYAKTKWRLTRT